jgi:hypothetical protein
MKLSLGHNVIILWYIIFNNIILIKIHGLNVAN